MKKQYTAQFLRIGDIAGIYYSVPNQSTKRICIYGRGAPLTPDNGKFDAAPHILEFDTDLFVPDYIGFGRSEGKLTPMNCVKTFLDLYDAFTKGTTAVCHYENKKIKLKYKDVYCIGGSFGGAYVPLLPRFNKKIKHICAIYPVTDWPRQGKRQPEETIEGFLDAMAKDGYQHLYRGILSSAWKKHFQGKDGLNPIDNVNYLKDAKVFIAHGKKDINISYHQSLEYYKKIQETFPNLKSQFRLKLYPYDHSDKTSNRAVKDYLTWVNIPKR